MFPISFSGFLGTLFSISRQIKTCNFYILFSSLEQILQILELKCKYFKNIYISI